VGSAPRNTKNQEFNYLFKIPVLNVNTPLRFTIVRRFLAKLPSSLIYLNIGIKAFQQMDIQLWHLGYVHSKWKAYCSEQFAAREINYADISTVRGAPGCDSVI
jgi:hypothetical protein